MSNVVSIKGAQQPPKVDQSRMDTLIVTQEMVTKWLLPDFQRPIRMNAKVLKAQAKIQATEAIDGVITLGFLKSQSSVLYIVDGQHRLEAFKLSGIEAVIVDVRVMQFNDFVEMAEEYVELNDHLVAMKPDDLLRGLERSVPALKMIRDACPFIGYDQVRRAPHSPVAGMAATLRAWDSASYDTPAQHGGMSVTQLAKSLDQKSTQSLIAFLSTAHTAWGSDRENHRLWGGLNLTICMWMWVRLVVDKDRFGSKRYVVIDIPQFKHCLMSVSAEADWLAWLPGRHLSERDRVPAYNRLKAIFTKRLNDGNSGKKAMLPQPSWSVSRG